MLEQITFLCVYLFVQCLPEGVRVNRGLSVRTLRVMPQDEKQITPGTLPEEILGFSPLGVS